MEIEKLRVRQEKLYQRIRELIKRHGPMTMAEMARRCRVSVSRIAVMRVNHSRAFQKVSGYGTRFHPNVWGLRDEG